jgi:CxxC motif-containing protein (DUF1111 family)
MGTANQVSIHARLKSLTLFGAIKRHGGEADQVTHRFRRLTAEQQQQLITFLKSL